MRSSEAKSGFGKSAVILASAAVLAGGWFEAEEIAKQFIGDYEGPVPQAPQAPIPPEKPEPKPAKRKSIEVAIGFDNSRSDIKDDLPKVISATREFLQKTDSFSDGDSVDICTFVESAKCEEFKLPDQKDALLNYVGGVHPEPPRHMETYVHAAISQIVEQTAADLVLAWTDADDETKGEKLRLNPDHPPVTIVVPKAKYIPNANAVLNSLGGRNINVDLALTSDEFGKRLESFAGELVKDAMSKARAEADKIHQQNLGQYNQNLERFSSATEQYQNDQKAYAEALKNNEARKVAVEAEVAKWKTRIKIAVGSIFAIFAGLVGLDIYNRSRPKLKGFIVDKRDSKYPRVYRVPSSKEPYEFKRIHGQKFTLTPTKGGISDGNKLLKDGDQIATGIYYYETEPSGRQR